VATAQSVNQPQPDPQQELRQLLDEFADQFDDRPGTCDAVVRKVQATDGLVRRQTRPCRAPDVCPVSRPILPSNSPMVRLIELVFASRTYPDGETKNDRGVRVACDYGYLNSVTVGDAFLIPTIDEVLRGIDKGNIMRSATTFISQICCYVSKLKYMCVSVLYLLLQYICIALYYCLYWSSICN